MNAKKKKRNVQQHFVTAAYLARFTRDGRRGSQLYIYERNTGRTFRTVPDEVAKQRNYYSIPLLNGDYADDVDVMLTALENQALPVLRKVLDGLYELTTFERALLATYIAFQEFRTPWARKNFQEMQLAMTEDMMQVAARAPGYFERIMEEMNKEGESTGSVTAEQVRDALLNGKIKMVADRHAGIDMMVHLGQHIGNFYAQMKWTVLRASDGDFLTSDSPVVRRNPGFRGGLYGGGLLSRTAEVWFPLSSKACLLIQHDAQRQDEFFKLLDGGKMEEAESLRISLPAITEKNIGRLDVEAINAQTIMSAERFVYAPFESDEIPRVFKGECKNMRISVSRMFSSTA